MEGIDRRTFLRNGLVAAGALAVSSCTRSSERSTSNARENVEDLTRPKPRPTVRMSGNIDFGVATPFSYFGAPGYQLMIFVYDTLLQEDTDGNMLPLLARAFDRSADGLTYTFQLRDGVRWHDERPVTAEDVVFTFDYFRSQSLSPQLIARPVDVVEAKTIDARTVQVRLARPAVTFPKQVAGRLPIVPRHIWSSISDAKSEHSLDVLVGSGPYRLESHTQGEGSYLYNAYDGYHLGKPFVKRIEFRPVSDDLFALQAGEIDVGATDVFGVPSETLVPFRGDRRFGILESKASITIPLKWNVGQGGALADPRFRQACARAIDRNDIVRRVTGGNGLPGNPAYLVPDNEFAVPVEQYPFDPGLANRALDEAGYRRNSPGGVREARDGKPLRYTLTVVSGIPAVLELVVAGLKNIGVDVTPKQVTLPTVLGGAPYDMVIAFDGGFGKRADPDHLRTVYSSKSAAFQHPFGYANPRVDELAERQVVTLDEAERRRLVAELQRLAAQDLPVLPLYYPTEFSIYRREVFDQWSEGGGVSVTEQKRNLMTGLKSGLTVRPGMDR